MTKLNQYLTARTKVDLEFATGRLQAIIEGLSDQEIGRDYALTEFIKIAAEIKPGMTGVHETIRLFTTCYEAKKEPLPAVWEDFKDDLLRSAAQTRAPDGRTR